MGYSLLSSVCVCVYFCVAGGCTNPLRWQCICACEGYTCGSLCIYVKTACVFDYSVGVCVFAPQVHSLDLRRDERVHKGKNDTLSTVNRMQSHQTAANIRQQTLSPTEFLQTVRCEYTKSAKKL